MHYKRSQFYSKQFKIGYLNDVKKLGDFFIKLEIVTQKLIMSKGVNHSCQFNRLNVWIQRCGDETWATSCQISPIFCKEFCNVFSLMLLCFVSGKKWLKWDNINDMCVLHIKMFVLASNLQRYALLDISNILFYQNIIISDKCSYYDILHIYIYLPWFYAFAHKSICRFQIICNRVPLY